MSSNAQLYRDLVRYGVFVCVPVGVAFADLVGSISRVDGVSMQPTLNPGHPGRRRDYVFANRLATYNYEFKRGEIVTLINPRDHKETHIKRIIGLPGDFVRPKLESRRQQIIPNGHCWVEGDNPHKSVDSNSYGPVSMGLIQAKVNFVIWPPSRVGKLEIKEPSALKVSDHRDPADIRSW